MIAQQNVAIKATLQKLTAAVEAYSAICEKNTTLAGLSQAGEVAQSHVKLMNSMKEMKTAVYGPMNMVTAHFEEVRQSFYYKTVSLTWSYNSSIRAVLELFWRWVSSMLYPSMGPTCRLRHYLGNFKLRKHYLVEMMQISFYFCQLIRVTPPHAYGRP